MTIDEVIKHFGSKAFAAAELSKSSRCIDGWEKNGIPYWSQLAIQGYTKGKLKAEPKEKVAS